MADARQVVESASGNAKPQPNVHRAVASFEAGPIRSRAEVHITTGGLLAVGALVGMILLSVAPVVWAATSPARKRAANRREV
ncbi:MAG: hypothetical protein ABL956_10905 [Hyphomonadaceae bacterium]